MTWFSGEKKSRPVSYHSCEYFKLFQSKHLADNFFSLFIIVIIYKAFTISTI